MDNFSDESWGELGWKARMALCTCAGGGRLLSGRCALNHFWSGESEFPGCKVSCSRAEGQKRNTVVGGLVGELRLPGLGGVGGGVDGQRAQFYALKSGASAMVSISLHVFFLSFPTISVHVQALVQVQYCTMPLLKPIFPF